MPDIIVHNRMGRTVYKNLPPEISSEIDREIYRLGLLGPDPYALYRFFAAPFRHGIHTRMSEMHQTKTADFLIEMAKNSESREMFSYLCGFLCHYALDSTAHPYIDALSKDQVYMHMAIERRLDLQELEKMGMSLSNRPITGGFFVPFLPESMRPAYEKVVKAVYGWDDAWSKYRSSYMHHKLFYYIVEDPTGLVDKVLRHVPRSVCHGKISIVSYQSHVCDGMSFDEFEMLRRKSIRKAIKCISVWTDYGRRTQKVHRQEKLQWIDFMISKRKLWWIDFLIIKRSTKPTKFFGSNLNRTEEWAFYVFYCIKYIGQSYCQESRCVLFRCGGAGSSTRFFWLLILCSSCI